MVGRYGLSFGVTEFPKSHGKLRLLVNVDGPLSSLQAFGSHLPLRAAAYCKARPDLPAEAARVILASARDSGKGMEAISSIVFSINRKFRQAGVKVKSRTLAVPPSLAKAAKSRRLVRRERDAVRTILSCVRRWTMERLSAKEVLILTDQAVEDWLRSRMPGAKTSSNFPALTRAGVESRLLSRNEAARLRRFHFSRTRSQHRGKVAASGTASSMLQFLLQLFESKYVDPSSPWERITPAEFLRELKKARPLNNAYSSDPLQKHLDEQEH